MFAWVGQKAKIVVSKCFSGRYLLLTNTVSCGGLLGAGDVIVQFIERVSHKDVNKKHDWRRTGRLATMGFVMGPFNHFWYRFLDVRFLGRSGGVIAKKIFADQIVASPFFAFSFFVGTGLLEGNSLKDSLGEFTDNFWSVYKTDWTVWPAAQTINFYFVPNHFRVVYVSFITLGWNTFLSYVKHRDQMAHFTEEEPTILTAIKPEPPVTTTKAKSASSPTANQHVDDQKTAFAS